MKKGAVLVMAIVSACLLMSRHAWADQHENEKTEKHEIVQGAKVDGEMLERVKISLQTGLVSAEHEGKPISAKFEVEDNKLQLSVYTTKAGKLSEVIVDHETGKVSKVEPITGGDDMAAAKAQSEAMAQAKIPLRTAVQRALQANKGFSAISVMPTVKDGHAIAEVNIGREEEIKTVSEKLD